MSCEYHTVQERESCPVTRFPVPVVSLHENINIFSGWKPPCWQSTRAVYVRLRSVVYENSKRTHKVASNLSSRTWWWQRKKENSQKVSKRFFFLSGVSQCKIHFVHIACVPAPAWQAKKNDGILMFTVMILCMCNVTDNISIFSFLLLRVASNLKYIFDSTFLPSHFSDCILHPP